MIGAANDKHDQETEETMKTRTIDKKFKLKQGEEIVAIRISIASVPVLGVPPKPKRNALLSAAIAPAPKARAAKPARVKKAAKAKPDAVILPPRKKRDTTIAPSS